MRGWIRLAAVLLVTAIARPVQAQTHYDFFVLYNGSGNATLAPGSDDPLGTTLQPADDFFWSIAAQGGGVWSVTTGGDFFPFMAFGITEPGDRIGTFALALRLGGVDQFNLAGSNQTNQYVHLGTNTVTLPTGLTWDTMILTYTLLDASDQDQIGDPAAPMIGSSPNTLLPIFGAPELNQFYPGIAYSVGQGNGDVVPEPATMTLLATGLAGMAASRRRRRA